MRLNTLVLGASGHAKVVTDAINSEKRYAVIGYIDDDEERHGDVFYGSRILGGRHRAIELLHEGSVNHIIVAIGDCETRTRLANDMRAAGFKLPVVIHRKAYVVDDVEIGGGSVIMAGAVVNSATTIGRDVIVNTSASVDHDCHISDGVHIAPGSHLAGSVSVGSNSWVGLGASVIESRRIGRNVMIGAGTVVIHDVPDGVTIVGNPARVVSRRTRV